ncbi:hypothetical protein Clacol_009395 [Clathrus columnatus]|uniref:Peptidase C14 caspase domain-containing protein n=1 Tax=Clathrus columnatus TaxID=1419009 RepID=A0AAV5AL21_9AGAM|nr:hypothetical protein Clacol_009395 [Clathrus columnatus]
MSSSSPPASQASTMNLEQSSQRLTLKTKKESLEDALGNPFTPFDVESMASAYDEESAKMVQFETDLNEMFLSVMLDVRAWALARPLIEQDNARVELSSKLREIERIEEDQGSSSGVDVSSSYSVKALCVGISYKGQKGPYGMPANQFELSGAHLDALRVCKLLIDHYDYQVEDINLLIDSPGHTPPTKENITTAMKLLTEEAEPGECLFFFYAGHGDQITNVDGTEDDGKDEIILPLDWRLDEKKALEDPTRYSNILVDDEMNDLLIKPLPPGCRFSSLFDSCHSGTILDLPYARYYGPMSLNNSVNSTSPISPNFRPTSPIPPWQIRASLRDIQTKVYHDQPNESLPEKSLAGSPVSPIELAHANHLPVRGPLDLSYTYTRLSSRGRFDPYWRDGAWVLRGEHLDHETGPDDGVRAVSWSACSDGQNGYEVSFPNASAGGVMVKAFVDILNENPYRTYGDILKCLG